MTHLINDHSIMKVITILSFRTDQKATQMTRWKFPKSNTNCIQKCLVQACGVLTAITYNAISNCFQFISQLPSLSFAL